MMTLRLILKPTNTTLARLRQSSHIPPPWYSLANSQHTKIFGFNPHLYFCAGKKAHSSGYNREYPKYSYSSVADTSKRFTTLLTHQTTGQELQSPHRHLQTSRHFQTSSTTQPQPQIAQNDKSRCLEVTLGVCTLTIPFIWLRDHCRSDKYYNHKTFQKNVDHDLLKQDLQPFSVGYTDDKSGIVVTWKDGHVSKFAFEFLVSHFYPGRLCNWTQRLHWDKTVMESLPSVSYNDHVTTDLGLRHSLTNLVKYGFTFVEGAPVSLEGIRAVVERISYVEGTIFGGMWMLTADASRGDTAYSKQRLGAHTDTTYMNTPAGIQVFQCMEHNGSGGETLLVDGFHAMEILRTSHPAAFETLSTTVVPHEYKEGAGGATPGYHLYSLATIISEHPASGELLQIRYNPYDRAPLNTVRPDYIQAFYEAYDKLARIIASPGLELWVKLEPGQVLLIDNWRVMHGRAEFDGKRVLGGCYLPRDVWTSKARLFGVL